MASEDKVWHSPVADSIPTDSGLSVQEEIDKVNVSASPGFTWGRSGNCPTGTWLLNDTVPSQKSGRRVFLNNASITRVFVSCESVTTVGFTIYEHTGGPTQVVLASINLVASRSADYAVNIPITNGKELAIRVVTGSAKNIQFGAIISGEL